MRDAPPHRHAHQVLSEKFEEVRLEQLTVRGRRPSNNQALVPHSAEDEGLMRSLRRDLLSEIDYEAGLFGGFEPRFFEWSFGRQGDIVEYAGTHLTGTIDRVDVDAHGGLLATLVEGVRQARGCAGALARL